MGFSLGLRSSGKLAAAIVCDSLASASELLNLEVVKARNPRFGPDLSCIEARLAHAPDKTYLEAAISTLPSEASYRRMIRHTFSELRFPSSSSCAGDPGAPPLTS